MLGEHEQGNLPSITRLVERPSSRDRLDPTRLVMEGLAKLLWGFSGGRHQPFGPDIRVCFTACETRDTDQVSRLVEIASCLFARLFDSGVKGNPLRVPHQGRAYSFFIPPVEAKLCWVGNVGAARAGSDGNAG